MSKRLNPQRRLIAKLKAFEAQAHSLTVAYNEEPLQKGVVRSSLSPTVQLTAYAVPRETWESAGKRGKIVGGKFKPVKVGAKQRFAAK